MSTKGFLFRGNEMSAVLDAQRKSLRDKIGSLTPKYICSVDEAELAQALADQYRIDIPVLDVSAKTIDPHEEKRCGRGDVGPFEYIVNIYTVHIPFTGEAVAFSFRPNFTDFNPPQARIDGQEVTIVLEQRQPDAMALKNSIERITENIQKNLFSLTEMTTPFNASLVELAQECIKRRKEKVSRDADILATLGIPIRQRSTLPSTIAVPVQRTSIPLPIPDSGTPPGQLDPIISENVYQQIIKTMADMALVIERNPTAFEHLNEEQIRFQFLVPLNALYEGNATAETFSYQGKTDIQIRQGGKPIFTAECKFWTGSKALLETVDQLLRYTTWRDTKTAILVFNRQREFSKVLGQVEPTMRKHASFVRFDGVTRETQFRFVLSHPSDQTRHIIVTVLLFDIP